jgi:malonate transporter and related proteins
MPSILAVTVPFFALVLCGYLGARSHALPQSAIPGLNAFVLFFALPCLLFRFGAGTPFSQLIDPVLIGVYAFCALVMVAFTVAMTLRGGAGGPGVDLKDAAFGALVAAFPNTGFMGVPLLVALLGERAAGPVIGTMLVDLFLTSSLCIALAQMHTHRSGDDDDGAARATSMRDALLRAIRGALTNPLPWAIAAGAVFSFAGWELTGAVGQVVRMLADAATPVALFTIGAVLWRAQLHTHTRTPPSQFVPVALFKLFVHPLLILAAGLLAKAAGVAVPPFGLSVLMLCAALPSASNVSLLAERYGADNGRVARIIMTSTALAFLSFSLLAWALGAQPKAAG